MSRSVFAAILLSVACIDAQAKDSIANFTLPNGVAVQIVEAPFTAGRFTYNPTEPCLVNNAVPFGTDCNRPSTYVKRLTVVVNGKTVQLNSSQMFDAWGQRPLAPPGADGFRYFGGRCSEENACVFRGIFSDGSGTFVAEWVVIGGKSIRTIVSASEDIVSQVMSNIDAKQ